MLLSMLLTVAFALVLFGVGLRRLVGWPTNLERVGRWGIALLVAVVLLAGVPELAAHVADSIGPLPTVDAVSLLCGLGTLGLGILGYVGWVNGVAARQAEQEAHQRTELDVRRRALPPPPQAVDEPPAGQAAFRPRPPQGPPG